METTFWTDFKRFFVASHLLMFGLGVLIGMLIAESMVAVGALVLVGTGLHLRRRARARC